jgi:hypothetical protein
MTLGVSAVGERHGGNGHAEGAVTEHHVGVGQTVLLLLLVARKTVGLSLRAVDAAEEHRHGREGHRPAHVRAQPLEAFPQP